jgi:hypothetical protein
MRVRPAKHATPAEAFKAKAQKKIRIKKKNGKLQTYSFCPSCILGGTIGGERFTGLTTNTPLVPHA